MTDRRYERGVYDLMSTFFSRTFQNMMPLILEVLETMKKSHSLEEGTICVSYGPIDLMKLINEVYDLSLVCSDPIVQKGVLGLIFKYALINQNDLQLPKGIQKP